MVDDLKKQNLFFIFSSIFQNFSSKSRLKIERVSLFMEVLRKEGSKKEVQRSVKGVKAPSGGVCSLRTGVKMIAALFGKRTPHQWSRRYATVFVGLVLFWALENFLLQVSLFDAPPNTTHPFSYHAIRLGLDVLAAAALVLLLPRFWLIAAMVADSAISLVIVAYTHYFHHHLSLYYELVNLKEGFKVASVAARIIPLTGWILLMGALVIKILWVQRVTPQPKKFRFQLAAFCTGVVALVILVLQLSSFSFSQMRNMEGSRAVFAYGNLTTWGAEFFYSPNLSTMAKELRQLQNVSPDRLSASEPCWPITGSVVVIQLESVGWDILDYKIQGEPVTPYLNSLARTSRTYKVRSFHALGSADMDYATLSDGTPSTRMLSYKIPGSSYTNALPRFMKEHGFHTESFHGNDGGFFSRLPNFRQMGFDEIWFKNDIAEKVQKPGSAWGVRDRDVLQYSSKRLGAASQPQFHFIITLDSHAPFNLIEEEEKQIYPHSQLYEENYFNSVRVLDQDVRNYVESLPAGTLVLLYGDHTPGVVYKDFHSARVGDAEYVPCIVHVCKPSTPWLAQPGPAVGLPEDLRIIDIMNYLRRQVFGQNRADSQKKQKG